jgi:hypothetical protein
VSRIRRREEAAAPRSGGGRRPSHPHLTEGGGGDNALDPVKRGGGDDALDPAEVVVAAHPRGRRGGEGWHWWAPLVVMVAVHRSWSSSSPSGPKLRAADRLYLTKPNDATTTPSLR